MHRDHLITALGPMAWGTTYIVTTQLLPTDHPLLIGTLRALPVGLLMVLALRQFPQGSWWWRSLLLGACNIGFFFALLFVAATRLPGGVAATLGSIQPLLVALLAWPLLGERPTRARIIAAFAGILGVVLIVIGPAARLDPVGIGAALCATSLMAFGTILTKRWGRPAPLLVFTAWQLVAGGLILVPLTLIFEGPPPIVEQRSLLGFLYLGIVNTGLAYALWFRGIERLAAGQVTFLALLSPVVAVVLGYLVLGQQLSLVQILGILIVLGSIVRAHHTSGPILPKNPQMLPKSG